MGVYDTEETRQARARVREIFRLAKARDIKLPFRAVELDDARKRQKFIAVFGSSPSEEAFAFASRIALSLGIELTAEQAMNRFHCSEFIRLNEEGFYDRAPSEKQVKLAERLAEIKGTKFPADASLDKQAWEEFMAQNVTRDDRDRMEELVWDLQVPNVDLSSYGDLVRYLSKEKELSSDPNSLRRAKEHRIKEMLADGSHPDSIQAVYPEFTEKQIYAYVDEVEAQGYEIAW